jgi:4-hydroxy-tetrahydrodipicolinate synthase
MVTPFTASGEVDYDAAKRLALALIESGSDGVVVTGTTGESPTVTKDEKLRLYREVKAAVGKRGSVIAGASNNDTRASIELCKRAEDAGVDGLLLVVPYYNNPPQEGLYQHFSAIAKSVKLPCMLYNVPSRTVRNMEAKAVIRLSQVPNIAGVKEASGNLEQIGAILDGVTRKDFRVWSGNDSDTLAIMDRGGYGVVSVASHLVGRQIKQLVEACARREITKARAMHQHLEPLFKDLFITTNPIPVKYALNQAGFRVGGFRLPLVDPAPEQAAVIMATVRRYTIDLPIPTAA